MPVADVDSLTINCDVQGEGDPLLLIPYLGADHACYAFQLQDPDAFNRATLDFLLAHRE